MDRLIAVEPRLGGCETLATDLRVSVDAVLTTAERCGADFCELFAEIHAQNEWRFEQGRVDQARGGVEVGVGIRLIADNQLTYVITPTLDPAVLQPLVEQTVTVLRGRLPSRPTGSGAHAALPPPNIALAALPALDETFVQAQLHALDAAARATSDAVCQVTLQFTSQRRHVVVATSEGLLRTDLRRFTRVRAQAIAARQSNVQTGVHTIALAADEHTLFAEHPAAACGVTIGTLAVSMLDAVPAPTGMLPVVVANGQGGVLIHEACVHCLEGDYIARSNSVYRDRLGQMVAQPVVTIVDDGTLPQQAGTSLIDDEGHPTQANQLVVAGRLQSYLTDRVFARRLGHASTGNGRRQSYAYLPMPRMTNTFVVPGDDTPEAILASTPYGVYAKRILGGEVYPPTGEFVFTVTEGYLIEGGRLTAQLIPFTLTGNGPDVLRSIDRVAHDFALATVLCGKNGQFVPVSVGQPTIRVSELVVGGTRR